MSAPGRLTRLLAIRQLAEEIDRRALALASSTVAEVESAIAAQDHSRAFALRFARTALVSGDRSEWLLADAQAEVAGWNRARLEPILRARQAEVPPAVDRYRASHRECEQLKLLVEAAAMAARRDEERKAQAEADDWFLSRRLRAKANGDKGLGYL